MLMLKQLTLSCLLLSSTSCANHVAPHTRFPDPYYCSFSRSCAGLCHKGLQVQWDQALRILEVMSQREV